MYKVHQSVQKIRTENGYTWETQCFHLPVLGLGDGKGNTTKEQRRRRSAGDSQDYFSNFGDFAPWDPSDFE